MTSYWPKQSDINPGNAELNSRYSQMKSFKCRYVCHVQTTEVVHTVIYCVSDQHCSPFVIDLDLHLNSLLSEIISSNFKTFEFILICFIWWKAILEISISRPLPLLNMLSEECHTSIASALIQWKCRNWQHFPSTNLLTLNNMI